MDLNALQGKAKKTRKFAAVKRLLSPNDARLYGTCSLASSSEASKLHFDRKENQLKQKKKEEEEKAKAVRRVYVVIYIAPQ